MQPTLDTARLRLRPFQPSDAPAVQRLAGDPAIAATTLHMPHPYPDGAAEAWIATHADGWSQRANVTFAITDRREGAVLGAISLMDIRRGVAELGYWIGVAYWGQGVCTEAGVALITFAGSGLPLQRLIARHIADNPASGRVLQKLGFDYVGQEAVIWKDTTRKTLLHHARLTL